MKKLLVISITLNALGLCLLVWTATRTASAGQDRAPAGNGDVNADGSHNLSDAVHLLAWLFQGGPAPAPIDCPPPSQPPMLPASGQSDCYDSNGNVIDCTTNDCAGQDGAYQAGCPRQGRFYDQGDGTVVDNCTGLMWQKSAADITGDGTANDEDLTTSCSGMLFCERMNLAGYEDWRLPNVVELLSIADYGRNFPAIDPILEVPRADACFLSSTSLRGGPAHGHFAVEFGLGMVRGGGGLACHVRAVRNLNSR